MNQLNINDYKGKRIHFIGIGGTGMNALAQVLHGQGYEVTGSDRSASTFTDHLQQIGVKVRIGHDPAAVEGAALIVFSAAIKPDNPERSRARELGIPEMERSELLGQISAQYKNVVAISGCHGKTTVSSMLALISREAALEATVHVGGFVDFLQGGILLGSSDTFITEACEYVGSFMHLRPTCVLINNIDDDHLDYYKDLAAIEQAFEDFTRLMPQEGVIFACTDDPRVKTLAGRSSYQVVSYGLQGGDYTAVNIRTKGIGTLFDVLYKGEKLFECHLNVPGQHNVCNALGAIAVARHLGAGEPAIARALEEYVLTRRRFELMGEVEGVKIYHDYAHHPSEIKACLQGARSVCSGKLFAVFQCNSYTRARTLFCQNVSCFEQADEILVPDIYPGRETDTGIVHAIDMTSAILDNGQKSPLYPHL